MNSCTQLRNQTEIQEEFALRGISITSWAKLHGFSAQLVYAVIKGRNRGIRGQSHEIAVRLGLKHGLIGNVSDIDVQITDRKLGAAA